MVLSGTISPEAGFHHSDEILAEILKTLKPNGQFYINDGKGLIKAVFFGDSYVVL